jgi:hypothetical protein
MNDQNRSAHPEPATSNEETSHPEPQELNPALPFAPPAAGTPPSPTSRSALSTRIEQLEASNAELRAELNQLRLANTPPAPPPPDRPKPKDRWDKVGLIIPGITTLVIGVLGVVFTTLYQQNQIQVQKLTQEQSARVQRMEVVSKFMPYLAVPNQEQKELAIVAMYTAGGAELASRVAALYPTIGTRNALRFMLASPSLTSRDSAVFAVALQNFPNQVVELRNAGPGNVSPARLDSLTADAQREISRSPSVSQNPPRF